MVYYCIKLYSIFRLQHKYYNSENGIEIQGEREMSLKELIQALNIDEKSVALITVNGDIVNDRNPVVAGGSTVCIFPTFPNGG
jgi:sulfur carrier protein ThiS